MRTARMSIMGLYNWDNTIFDLLVLPEGMNRDTLISLILSECSDMETLYPNPVVMKALIGVWSNASQYTWNTLYNTINLQYNPIENYDRTEERTLESIGEGTSTDSGTDTLTSRDSGSDTIATDSTDTEQVAGFETTNNQFVNKNKNTLDSDSTTTYGKTTTNTNQYGKSNSNDYTKNDTETIRAHGNIGVTSSQQMIQQERDIALFNVYDKIVEDFKTRYCILIY